MWHSCRLHWHAEPHLRAAVACVQGWETFTNKAISVISSRRSGVVFLLWGRPAQTKAKLINGGKHHVLMCAHPSGLSANKGEILMVDATMLQGMLRCDSPSHCATVMMP